MKVRTLIWSTMLLLMLVAYLPVMAQDASEAAAKPQAQKTMPGGPQAPQVFTFDTGEVVIRTWAVTENTQRTRTEGAFQPVPNANILVTVPAGRGPDLLIATFSGECRLFGTTDNDDRVEIQIRDNNVPLPPTDDLVHGLSFCSEDRWAAHSAQALMRLSEGPHRIQVFWRLVDTGMNDVLTGWLDDYALVVLQSE
jgi:hypothetical protein